MLYGIYMNNPTIYIYSDIIAFSAVFTAVSFKKEEMVKFFDLYPKSLLYMIIIGLPMFFILYLYMKFQPGSIATARFNYDSSTKLYLYSPTVFVMPALVLLFFSRGMKTISIVLILISIFLVLYMGIITLSRNILFSVTASIVLYFLFISRNNKKLSLLLSIFVLSIYLFQSQIISNLGITESKLSLIKRFETESTFSGRVEEMADYFSSINAPVYIFGKGLGGIKILNMSHSYIGGANMLHFGWAHLIMKGGIILLFLTYGCGLYSIIKLWNTSE